jgi:hypothetical protein
MEDASMTSDNVNEPATVEVPGPVSAKFVVDQLIDELVGRAQAEGLQLTGEGGLLQQLTKRLLESALDAEITDHLGYDKHDPAGMADVGQHGLAASAVAGVATVLHCRSRADPSPVPSSDPGP